MHSETSDNVIWLQTGAEGNRNTSTGRSATAVTARSVGRNSRTGPSARDDDTFDSGEDSEALLTYLADFRDLLERSNGDHQEGYGVFLQAQVELMLGNERAALDGLHEAREIFRELEDLHGVADTMLINARIAQAAGQTAAADEMFSDAAGMYALAGCEQEHGDVVEEQRQMLIPAT
jgi:hypothetical protein